MQKSSLFTGTNPAFLLLPYHNEQLQNKYIVAKVRIIKISYDFYP